MKKILIIAGAVILAVLLIFTSLWIIKNSQIASIANEIGKEYGVKDFKSKSAKFNGQVWAVELHSKDFDELPKEERFELMVAIGNSSKMKSKLVKRIAELDNPLVGARFAIYSNGRYILSLETDDNRIWIEHKGNQIYGADGIAEHGYVIHGNKFTNKFGTKDTICVVDGCYHTIASSGDTNCCIAHSNNCGNCGCFIDGDAAFCMSCLEKALK